uniref:THAP4-like heme-binding domain-containing protein n=1 Tax=Oncorhynchus kisutch TaxID=8019 RepID=A0A8C7I0U9_ONCKI
LRVWESDKPGEGSFSSIPPFRYTETLHLSHVGQPVINFNKKSMHRECGFLRMQQSSLHYGTNLRYWTVQTPTNSGGDLTGQQSTRHAHALARTPCTAGKTGTFQSDVHKPLSIQRGWPMPRIDIQCLDLK